MYDTIKNVRNYTEYIPIMLLGILFIAEEEIERHAINISYQMAISAATAVVFFVLFMRFKLGKRTCFLLATLMWLMLIYVKRVYHVR